VASHAIFQYIYSNLELLDEFKSRYVKILQDWTTRYHRETISIQANASCYLIYLLKNNVESRLVKLLSNTMKLQGDYDLDFPLLEDCVDAFLYLEEPRYINALIDICSTHD
jgi:hypothetical protein